MNIQLPRSPGFASRRAADDDRPMQTLSIRLAHAADADAIALMSRDLVEQGLGWSWTAARVRRAIGDRQTNVAIAPGAGATMGGFGIMRYGDDDAHLLLLAVRREQLRNGIGSALVEWLERSAQVAGIGRVVLEARVTNVGARAFYRFHGYQEVRLLPGYYGGREASVRFVKDLRVGRARLL
jgi:ribosomal-protein-alanine N-acetyltransferase